jgi:isopentenyl-diphosphate delta-isomerase
MDDLICVDILDRPIGKATKEVCHEKGLLHRAFSIFIYNNGKLLLQQRAMEKYHSGGLWTNACCSHPRYGESLYDAVPRRLCEELDIKCLCEEIGTFTYFHQFGSHLYEYEYDHVFLGKYKGGIKQNPSEVMAVKWIDIEELSRSIMTNPELYTIWFLTAAPMVIQELDKRTY